MTDDAAPDDAASSWGHSYTITTKTSGCQVISQRRAHEMDFNFFKDIANKAELDFGS